MPPAGTAVADSNLPNCEIFKIAAEKSRTSTEIFSAKETVDGTRGVMEIVANMAIVTKMEITTNTQIAARMETVTRMVTVDTTTGRVVRMPRAARTSPPMAILSRPVARQTTANGDRR